MKKLLVVIVFLSVVSLGAEAQQEKKIRERVTPEKAAERITDRMSSELELSEDQRQEVYTLHLENINKRAEEIKALREKYKADQQAYQETLVDILTPEQKEKWEAKRKDVSDRRVLHKRKTPRMEGKRGSRGFPAEDAK